MIPNGIVLRLDLVLISDSQFGYTTSISNSAAQLFTTEFHKRVFAMSVIKSLMDSPRGCIFFSIGRGLRTKNGEVDGGSFSVETLRVSINNLHHVHVVYAVVNQHGRCRQQVDVVERAALADLLQCTLNPCRIPTFRSNLLTQLNLGHPCPTVNNP